MPGRIQPHYTAMQLQQLWIRAGGSAATAPLAAAVALAESGGNPNAIGTNTNGTLDRGLWQINSVHGAQSTLDPLANAQSAVSISQGGSNWQPWTTYVSGAYKKFLGEAKASASTATATEGSPGISIPNPLQPITDTASAIGNVASAIGDFTSLVTSGAFWLRVLEVIGGVALLAMGLMTLGGRTTTPITVAKGAAKNAGKAAAVAV